MSDPLLPRTSSWFPSAFPSPAARVGVLTRSLLRMPHLAAFLGSEPLFRPALLPFGEQPVAALAGREGRTSASRAKELAASHNLPYLALEDGFLRSMALPGRDAPTCSLIADDTGLFYDAGRPSRLENLLNASGWETPSLMAEADRALHAMLGARLSKYNHAPHASPYQLCTPSNRTRILVIDQWEGDPKVTLGMADADTFRLMLEQACRAHPGAAVFVKPHPFTLAGRKRGYLAALAAEYGARVIEHDFSAPSLLAQADEVYTVSSLMGFEALLQGKPVHCFGLPFYAGWGLTRDRAACPRRTRKRGAAEIFAAAYLLCSRYVNPVTGEACTIHEIIRLLAGQRRQNDANRGYAACLGFSGRAVRKTGYFLWSTDGNMQFFRDAASAVGEAAVRKKTSGHARVVVRASQEPDDLAARCAAASLPLLRTAWGILRPPTENADALPLSLAQDSLGMYYDASRPSGLERILSDSPLLNAPDMLARARALREAMLPLYARPVPERDPEAAAMLEELDRADAARGDRPLVVVAGQLVAAPRGKDSRVEGHEREEEMLRFLRRKNPDALREARAPRAEMGTGAGGSAAPPARSRSSAAPRRPHHRTAYRGFPGRVLCPAVRHPGAYMGNPLLCGLGPDQRRAGLFPPHPHPHSRRAGGRMPHSLPQLLRLVFRPVLRAGGNLPHSGAPAPAVAAPRAACPLGAPEPVLAVQRQRTAAVDASVLRLCRMKAPLRATFLPRPPAEARPALPLPAPACILPGKRRAALRARSFHAA